MDKLAYQSVVESTSVALYQQNVEFILVLKAKVLSFVTICSDFPCDLLQPVRDKADGLPHNTKVFNLCLIKKMGLEKWAKEKAKKVKEDYFYKEWEI